jgi:hypothetical protein
VSRPWLARALAWVSRLLMGATLRLLGTRQGVWGRAMLAEIEAAPNEREALAFAWGCFCTATGHAFTNVLARLARPQAAGAWACAATVVLGCAFMHAAGAPARYVVMNLLSLAFAVASFWLLPRQRLAHDEGLRAKLSFAMGALLLASSWGQGSAWVALGPVHLNLAWLLLPALLVGAEVGQRAAAQPWALGGLWMALGALVRLADPLLLGLVAAVLSARAWRCRSGALACLAVAAWAAVLHAGAGWTAPARAPFLDSVLQSGFDRSWPVGLALALLQLLPLWPALQHRNARPLGLVWGLLLVLSVPGWLPSPLLGFGGSFILGYLLSLALLPGNAAKGTPADPPASVPRSRAYLA